MALKPPEVSRTLLLSRTCDGERQRNEVHPADLGQCKHGLRRPELLEPAQVLDIQLSSDLVRIAHSSVSSTEGRGSSTEVGERAVKDRHRRSPRGPVCPEVVGPFGGGSEKAAVMIAQRRPRSQR